jgi:secondary thiamine-phosphate synthase enzyme
VPVVQKEIHLSTRGHSDVQDITPEVARIVAASEFEPGCVADLQRALEQIAPDNTHYAHNARWGDENGFAHLRSALMGTTKSYPIAGGRIAIGTWQQIVLCDFDDRPRERQVLVTVIGE